MAQQASLAELTAFFRQQGYTCPRKIPAVYAQLQAPAIPVAAWQVRVYQRQMLVFVELLATVSTQVRAYESELARLLTQHADAAIFLSLPNAGVVTAAGLLGEIGDCRAKFTSASGLQALAGTCPVTKQSNRLTLGQGLFARPNPARPFLLPRLSGLGQPVAGDHLSLVAGPRAL